MACNYKKCYHILVNFVDFSSIQKYPDTWIPMDKLSAVSKYPWYPTIHNIQAFMVSNYPDIRKSGIYSSLSVIQIIFVLINMHVCLFFMSTWVLDESTFIFQRINQNKYPYMHAKKKLFVFGRRSFNNQICALC